MAANAPSVTPQTHSGKPGHGVGKLLAVRVLEVTEYGPSGIGYDTHSFRMPSWEQIESAVLSLDHHRLPFFFVGLQDVCNGENCLSVLGGPNGYAITAEVPDRGWVQYFDPAHRGGPVDVWTSDQGFYPDERYVSYDVGLVTRITRYYAEFGRLDPSVQWEST